MNTHRGNVRNMPNEAAIEPRLRWMFRVRGVVTIISAIAAGGLSWLVLSILAGHMRKNPEVIKDLPPLVMSAIQHRGWFPLFVMPALVCGVLLLGRSLRPAIGWTLITAATLWLLAMVAFVVYCFIMFLAPLYSYQPL